MAYSAGMARSDVGQVLGELIGGGGALPRPFVGDGGEAAGIRVRTAPGRLDVMGAMGAVAGGTVAQMALPARVAVGVQRWERRAIVVYSDAMEAAGKEGGGGEVTIGLEGIERGEVLMSGGAWGGLIVGLWRALMEAGVALPRGWGFGYRVRFRWGLGRGVRRRC